MWAPGPVGPDDGLNSTPHISKSGKTVPYNSFYLKVLFFKKIQKSLNIWARFVGNFFTKNFKNRPIWSHWNLCVSIWRAVQVAAGDLDPSAPGFSIGLFDPLAAEPLKVLKAKPKEVLALYVRFLKNIAIGPWTIAKAAHKLSGKSTGTNSAKNYFLL